MATDRRWELLAVLLLTLQPAIGHYSHHNRHWSSTPPTVIKMPEPVFVTSAIGPSTLNPTTVTCSDSGNVVLRLSRIGMRVVRNNVVASEKVKELYLDENGITEVSCGAFDKVPNLETLNLMLNNISTDRLLYFGEHKGLRRLIVDDNNPGDPKDSELKTILKSLPNLWELSLRRSFIEVFSVSLTEFAPNLGRLSLSGNKIESSEFLKDAPKNLKHLDLSENMISNIGAWLSNRLLELTVAGNRIKELCDESCGESSLSFLNMASLRTLNASRNAIATIQPDAFRKLTNLTVLDLSGNDIRVLSETLWDKPWEIQKLYLAKNKLTSIPKLCQLVKLQRLDLSGNLISSVTNENFCWIVNQLQFLSLKDNIILELDGAVFRKLHSLHTLDLSGNLLITVPRYLINSTSLEVLFIRKNKINTLENLGKERSNLRELHLQDNPLVFIYARWINWSNLRNLRIMLKDLSIEDKAECYQEVDEQETTFNEK